MKESEHVNSIGLDKCFHLLGAIQCWTAAIALEHSGMNPELHEDMADALKSFDAIAQGSEVDKIRFTYSCEGDEEYVGNSRKDIIVSLLGLKLDPLVPREQYAAANELLLVLRLK